MVKARTRTKIRAQARAPQRHITAATWPLRDRLWSARAPRTYPTPRGQRAAANNKGSAWAGPRR
eukprot:980996-Prymnesium_polylepis.1